MEMNRCAPMERGKITSVSEDGYTVASFDRDGIISPPIGDINDADYTVGDIVYFFLFSDGTGKIMCKA